ncbi:putative serine protease F56F10.1 isoform X2 [Folsomia candida]|uniref:putative serine protease F56F10.1 isoform X2 n=1 Tax=Folsomia candida TaxID=158441 RepID=UPI001604E572|nr:putative serine protease F56F10.1 isoform X2 [Folsomia candida]
MIFQNVVSLLVILHVVVAQENIEEKIFEQKLDHENSSSTTTWRQRYLENRQFFKPGGPIFVYYGGPTHSPFSPTVLQTGSMTTYAKEQGANLVALESRYYGRSRPTLDLSEENLRRYLSLKQKREDYAEFVRWLKRQPDFTNSKIVGFGSGLIGSLVLDVMNTYSDGVVDIGVISSAPVEYRYEVPEYVEKMVELLNTSHPECYDSIHDTLICFERLSKGEECQGHVFKDLKNMFNLCGDIDQENALDISTLRLLSLRTIATVMSTNDPDPNASYNTEKMCRALEDNSTNLTHFERSALEVRKISSFSKQPCVEARFDKVIGALHNSSWDSPAVLSGQRQTMWLRCSQTAMIRTPVGFRMSDNGQFIVTTIEEMCNRLFNISSEQMKHNSQEVNQLHGSRRLPSKCAVFVTGSDDLFQNVSVTTQSEVGNCNRAYLIPGASFAKNTGEIKPEGMSYPPALRMSQLEIGSIIGSWLSSGNCCLPQVKEFYENPSKIFDLF